VPQPQAKAGAYACRIREELHRIHAALTQLERHELLQRLLPGVELNELRARLGDIAAEIPTPLADLYAWRNGTRVEPGTPLDGVHLFPGYWFLQLDDAVRVYEELRAGGRWHDTWLPLFTSGGGDYYAADLASPECQIIGHVVYDTEQRVEFVSLEAMIASIAESFADGIFFVHDAGYLEMVDDGFARVRAKHNQSS
jgi:hypothetical protein